MEKNLFKKYPTNFQEIAKYLLKAKQDLADASKILNISEEASFKTSYDAMIKASLALAMTYGLRPRSQSGHHSAMIGLAGKILGAEYLTVVIKVVQKKNPQKDLF